MNDFADKHELVRLAFERGGSVRLRNSLLAAQNDGVLENITVTLIADDDPEAIRKLMHVQNLGAKTLAELKSLVALPSSLHLQSAPPATGQSPSTPEGSVSQVYEPQELTIESVADALDFLEDSARHVISQRLGLDGSPPKRLAEIGDTMGVSRERIRQIEFKAIERLNRMFGVTLSRMRLLQQGQVLAQWSAHNVIPDQDEGDLFLNLPIDMRLLVRVEYKSARNWLDSVCRPIRGGWLLPAMPDDSYENARGWFEGELKALRLPCPITYLQNSEAPPQELLEAVIQLSETVKVYEGYLLPRASTRRARRAARVHRLLWQRDFARPTPLSELKAAYRNRYLDDQCSARDLVVILFDYPHLFLNLYETGWLPLGKQPALASPSYCGSLRKGELVEELSEEPMKVGEADTLKGILAQILLQQGPQSFNDLRRFFVSQVGNRYSKASVGPVLISTDEFPRIGPGIYAHRSQLGDQDLLEQISDRLLLNRAQCETFCRAVWAGEKETTYPLWTVVMQSKWADWCYGTGQMDLLSSLLSVCDIASWPIKAGDKARWSRLQDQHRIYLLEEPAIDLEDRIPLFREFLAAAALAVGSDGISWIGINRATGYRVEDRHAASVLSLLIAIGIVQPATHWQQLHRIAETASQIVKPLLCSIRVDEQSRWPKAVVRALRANYDRLPEPGWTKEESMQRLFDALTHQTISDELIESEVLKEIDPYEQLKKKLSDALMFENMQKKLAERSRRSRGET